MSTLDVLADHDAKAAAAMQSMALADVLAAFRDGSGRALTELLRRGEVPDVLPRPAWIAGGH